MEDQREGAQESENESGREGETDSNGGQDFEVPDPGMGASLSPSLGISQQPGPSGLNFSSPSLSASLGGPNFPSPPQPGPSRSPQDVFAVSDSQDVLGGGVSQHLNFDISPQPPINRAPSVPQRPENVRVRELVRDARGRVVKVPSVSEISSQSSDEDTMRRRRLGERGGSEHVPLTSHLRPHLSALPLQQLDISPSESSGTDGLEGVVPDPKMLRKLAQERADRNPQAVPKMPSRLKREMKTRERLASTSTSVPDSSQPTTSGAPLITSPTANSTPSDTTTSSPYPSSSANDPESSLPPEPESAYDSASSLVLEAGPSHTHLCSNSRSGGGEGGDLDEETQPLSPTSSRGEALNRPSYTQSPLRTLRRGGSSETTGSSSNSSFDGVFTKIRGVKKFSPAGAHIEEEEEEEREGGGEGETQPLDQSTSPFARDTQSPDVVTAGRSGVPERHVETVPSTPTGSVDPSLPPDSAAASTSASQDLFQDCTPPIIEAPPTPDQDPSWYPSLASRQQREEEEKGGRKIGRQISTESSSPDTVCGPPKKKMRLSSTSGVNVLKKWEESERRGLSQGDKDTSGSSSSSSSHQSSTPSSSSSSRNSDGKRGGGGAGGVAGGGNGSSGGSFSTEKSSLSGQSQSGKEEAKTYSDSHSTAEMTLENSEGKNMSLSFPTTHLLDPSSSREGDVSLLSIASSFPKSSLESCVATSTPQEEEGVGNVSPVNVSSLSVGYGGTEEKEAAEKEKNGGGRNEVAEPGGRECEESREAEVEMREVGEDDADSDATRLGSSDTECAECEGTTSNKDTPMEEGNGNSGESASPSWRLLCSANTNTCSETKSSASDHTPQPPSSDALHLCLSQTDSLPLSELPLVIDLPQSQSSTSDGDSSPVDEVGPTAVAEVAKRCETSGKQQNSEREKIGHSDLVSHGKGEENGVCVAEEERRGSGSGIREAWNLLQREKMSEEERSKGETQEESDLELVEDGEDEGREGAREMSSQSFSLRLSQSQTTPSQDKTTPMTGKATPTTVNHSVLEHQDLQPVLIDGKSCGSGTSDVRSCFLQDKDRTCPKPVYESIGLSESAAFVSSPLPPPSPLQPSQTLSSHPPSHSLSPHPSNSGHSSQEPVSISASSESHGNETSQAPSSSAQFEFQLPQNGLLRPHQYTSPPSLHTPLTLSPSPPPPAPTQPELLAKKTRANFPTAQPTHNPLQSSGEAGKKKTKIREKSHRDKSKEGEGDEERSSSSIGEDSSPSECGKRSSREAGSRTVLKLRRFYGGKEGEGKATSSVTPQRATQHVERRGRGGEGGGGRFVLGAGTDSRDEEMIEGDDSQNQLQISIPGDSQFETSADSQMLLDCLIQPPADSTPSAPPGEIFQAPPTPRSMTRSSTPQPSNLPPPRSSIFSSMLTSRRRKDQIGAANKGEGSGREDPFEFDSESHESPAEFVPRRRKKKGSDEGRRQREEFLSENDDSQQVESSTAAQISPNSSLAPVSTSSLSPSSQPHSSTPSHPPPVPQQPTTVIGPFPHTPQTPVSHSYPPSTHSILPPHLSPAGSLPLYSTAPLPFTSPISRVAHEDVSTASRGHRAGGNRYTLRHTHTYRHMVEVKIVSQEVYEGDKIVEGLSTVWQEHSAVSSPPLESVDVHPHTSSNVPSSPAHTLSAIPVPVLPQTLSLATPGNLQQPNPRPTAAAPAIIPVGQVYNGGPPSESDGGVCGGVDDEEEDTEEPVVSEGNESPLQTQSTIEQTPQRGRQMRRPLALATAASSSSSSGQRTIRSTPSAASPAVTPRRVNGAGGEEMGVGSLVIARWRNHSWYPATVTGVKNGRLSVRFEDGDKSSVSHSRIFHRTQLKREMSVIAMDDSKDGQRGHFAGFVGPALTDWFLVSLTEGERRKFACDQLEVPPATAELCIGGKTRRGVKRVPSETLASPASKRRCVLREEGEEDTPCDSHLSLFKGLSFILTMRIKEDRHLATPPNEQIDREKVASLIRSRMGYILNNVPPIVTGNSCFVLSDSYCRTKKYLMGLAMGLPCVSYCWVRECVDKGVLVDHTLHLLPAGLGRSEELMSQQPGPLGTIMAGVTLNLEGDKDFRELWSFIIRKAGASLKDVGLWECVASLLTGGGAVVVSESGRQKRASRGPKTLVRPDWLVQCVISGERLDWEPFVWGHRQD